MLSNLSCDLKASGSRRSRIAATLQHLIFAALLASPSFTQAKIKSGSPFPEFKLPALTGSGTVNSSQIKGKVVIIDFWASWCGPCKVELPFLSRLQAKYKNRGLLVVAINLDENRSDALSFLKENPLKLTLAYDGAKQDLVKKCDLDKMPTSFILDRGGNITKRHEAFRSGDEIEFEKEIVRLLSAK